MCTKRAQKKEPDAQDTFQLLSNEDPNFVIEIVYYEILKIFRRGFVSNIARFIGLEGISMLCSLFLHISGNAFYISVHFQYHVVARDSILSLFLFLFITR